MKTQVLKIQLSLALLFAIVFSGLAQFNNPYFNESLEPLPPGQVSEIINQEVLPIGLLPEFENQFVEGQYIVFLNAQVLPPFLDQFNVEQFSNREQQRQAYLEFDQSMRQQIYEIVESQMEISREQITQVYTGAFTGIAAQLRNDQVEQLVSMAQSDELIESIAKDVAVSFNANETMEVAKKPVGQYVDWGVKFTGSGDASRLTRWGFVLDTGIDMKHPDLTVVSSWSRSCVPGQSTAQDFHGHGTHVAGIIGAKDNSIGTKGVASGAKLVAVKVLGSNGVGQTSWILKGVSYAGAVAWRSDVLNLSLGGPRSEWWHFGWLWGDPRISTENALKRIGRQGKYVVIAAGNSADDACKYSPAQIGGGRNANMNVFTISNMTSAKKLYQGSNYGNCVDFAAPGTNIYSTWTRGGYAYATGTSMAAPHLAGILVLTNSFQFRGKLLWDRDSRPDPIVVTR